MMTSKSGAKPSVKADDEMSFSALEVVISTCLYAYFICVCFYRVYETSLAKEDVLSFDLHPSWWFGRRMDDSDYEWRFWADFFGHHIYWYIVHAAFGLVINHQMEKGRIFFNIAYSLLTLPALMGLKQLAVIVGSCCLVYMSVIVFRRKSVVWIVSLLLLGLLNMQGSSNYLMRLCYPDPTGSKYMVLVYAMSIGCLRFVSLGTDLVEEYSRSNVPESFYKALCYTLYFPTFLSGPFITYRQFIDEISQKTEKVTLEKMKSAASQSLLLIAWWLLMEISLHYFYATALQQEEYFLISADNLTLFAICLVQAALFNLKYLFIFGVPTLFAWLDGLQMPARPVFLLTEYKASAIWRKFDIGLYNFITSYMYVPMGGSRYGLSQQVITMFVCFVFIGFWHGASVTMFIWVLVNFVAIFLENVRLEMLKTPRWRSLVSNIGEEAAYRIQHLLLSPIGVISLWSMFVFLGGRTVGYNLYKKLFRSAPVESRLTLVGLAYWHIVFAQSLAAGSVPGAFRELLDKGRSLFSSQFYVNIWLYVKSAADTS